MPITSTIGKLLNYCSNYCNVYCSLNTRPSLLFKIFIKCIKSGKMSLPWKYRTWHIKERNPSFGFILTANKVHFFEFRLRPQIKLCLSLKVNFHSAMPITKVEGRIDMKTKMTSVWSALLMSRLQKKVPKFESAAKVDWNSRDAKFRRKNNAGKTTAKSLRSSRNSRINLGKIVQNCIIGCRPSLWKEDCFSIFQKDLKNVVATTPQICEQSKEPLTFGAPGGRGRGRGSEGSATTFSANRKGADFFFGAVIDILHLSVRSGTWPVGDDYIFRYVRWEKGFLQLLFNRGTDVWEKMHSNNVHHWRKSLALQ